MQFRLNFYSVYKTKQFIAEGLNNRYTLVLVIMHNP